MTAIQSLTYIIESFLVFGISILLVFGVLSLKNLELNSEQSILKYRRFSIREEDQLWLKNINSIFQSVLILSILALFISFILLREDYTFGLFSSYPFLLNQYVLETKSIISLTCLVFLLLLKNSRITFSFEVIIIMLLSLVGLFLVVSANDLLGLYLGIELQSLAFYVLAASARDNEYSTEAGLKYFVLGSLASGFLLLGSALTYGFSGSIHLDGILALLQADSVHGLNSLENPGLTIGILLISIGLFFKLAVAPFHVWITDVYQGAPFSVTTFFAIVPKIGLVAFSLRLCLKSFMGNLSSLILFLSLLSIIIGGLGGLYQLTWKRLLAYSAISHMGFIFLGFYSSFYTMYGLQSIFIYLLIYIFLSFGSFTFVFSLHSVFNKSLSKYIADVYRLNKGYPFLATSLTISFLSMAGIPPLAGFFSKYYIFVANIYSTNNDPGLYFFLIIAILASVVPCFYYLRILKLSYFLPSKIPNTHVQKLELWSDFLPPTLTQAYILASSILLSLTFILFPSFIVIPAQELAYSF